MKAEWPRVKLVEVLRFRQESPDMEELLSGKVPIVSKIGFKTGVLEFRSEAKTKTNMILIRPGDLVMSGINAIKGAIAIYTKEANSVAASTIHYSAYEVLSSQADARFLWWFFRSRFFQNLLFIEMPDGIKTELKASRFLPIEIPLPPLTEQKRIVAQIDELEAKIADGLKIINEIDELISQTLLSAFRDVAKNVKFLSMSTVAPLTRRPVKVNIGSEYHELGVRSFGKGTFHKPPLSGATVGSKKLYQIFPGDLVFNNVFAWEGAVAVAKKEDIGRVGSHRFIACIPQDGVATSEFLRFYFLTDEGLEKLGEASPGGAGRNRTLGLEALGKIKVPIPSIEKQLWFDTLQSKIAILKKVRSEATTELDALLPSILDKAFRGVL